MITRFLWPEMRRRRRSRWNIWQILLMRCLGVSPESRTKPRLRTDCVNGISKSPVVLLGLHLSFHLYFSVPVLWLCVFQRPLFSTEWLGLFLDFTLWALTFSSAAGLRIPYVGYVLPISSLTPPPPSQIFTCDMIFLQVNSSLPTSLKKYVLSH